MKSEKITCPECNSDTIIKKGKKKNIHQTLQRYKCKDCNKTFTLTPIKGTTYPLRIILKTISTYNLGHTLQKTSELIDNKFKLNIKSQTISNWLNQYKQRHQAIQNFFLTNDSTTIATEIPVYLTKDDLLYFLSKGFSINPRKFKTPVTGHIDILQIRNNLIHILDYKPEASKANPIEQLTIYALALASRTKLALKDFKCAWFDENNYYEFFPLHAVYQRKS